MALEICQHVWQPFLTSSYSKKLKCPIDILVFIYLRLYANMQRCGIKIQHVYTHLYTLIFLSIRYECANIKWALTLHEISMLQNTSNAGLTVHYSFIHYCLGVYVCTFDLCCWCYESMCANVFIWVCLCVYARISLIFGVNRRVSYKLNHFRIVNNLSSFVLVATEWITSSWWFFFSLSGIQTPHLLR